MNLREELSILRPWKGWRNVISKVRRLFASFAAKINFVATFIIIPRYKNKLKSCRLFRCALSWRRTKGRNGDEGEEGKRRDGVPLFHRCHDGPNLGLLDAGRRRRCFHAVESFYFSRLFQLSSRLVRGRAADATRARPPDGAELYPSPTLPAGPQSFFPNRFPTTRLEQRTLTMPLLCFKLTTLMEYVAG